MKVLVVEDELKMASLLLRGFRNNGHAADVTRTGEDAVWMAAATHYDAIVLDVMLPGIDGFETLARLRKKGSWTPVLILTARDSVHDRIHGLDIGADDYLIKPFEMGELEARIRALARRARGIAENEITLGRLVIDLKGRRALIDGAPVELSARELAVLEILAARAGRVVSKDALMNSLYEWEQDVSPNAIEIHVHRLRKKLMDSGIVIRTIRGLGYLLERPPNAA